MINTVDAGSKTSPENKNDTKGTSSQGAGTPNGSQPNNLPKTGTIDQSTSDFVWKAFIIGFVIVFIGTAFAIALGIFMSKSSEALLPLVTIFTTTVGILAPSPFQKGQSTTNTQIPNGNQV